MTRRRCDQCGRTVAPKVDRCPECGGEIRVTITEAGNGTIEYLLRKTPPKIREKTMNKHRHRRGSTNRKPPYKWANETTASANWH